MTEPLQPGDDTTFEDEGIPDLQEGTPGQQWARDPQELPLPGDDPTAVDDFGTTIDEQIRGESLDDRLAREEPEPVEDPLRPRAVDEPVDGGYVEGEDAVGRLVEPDEGAHPDTEKDSIARDVGPDWGGRSAEEQAMHLEPEDRGI